MKNLTNNISEITNLVNTTIANNTNLGFKVESFNLEKTHKGNNVLFAKVMVDKIGYEVFVSEFNNELKLQITEVVNNGGIIRKQDVFFETLNIEVSESEFLEAFPDTKLFIVTIATRYIKTTNMHIVHNAKVYHILPQDFPTCKENNFKRLSELYIHLITE